MIFVRVDDRLLHGQVLCAWVPYLKAEVMLIASDDVAADDFRSAIMDACGCEDLEVLVKRVEDAAARLKEGVFAERNVMIVVGSLKDAARLREKGVIFLSVNVGNVHHCDGGRKLSRSVTVNAEDDEAMERLSVFGVEVTIKELPAGEAVPYKR